VPALPQGEPLSLRPLAADTWRTLRAHPLTSTALGAAALLSMASMVFGIGVLVTPWFLCEIFALQLAVLAGITPRRDRAWFRAGFLVLCMVGVVVGATWLAMLIIGPDVATADRAIGPLPRLEALRRAGLIALVTLLAVGFIAPFVYAPLIVIERGTRIGAAVLESAWLVRRGGFVRHWGLAFVAHLLPIAPALIAAVVVARTFERAATPYGVLIGLPLVPLTIPLGQGLVTAAYAQRRHELAIPRWTRAEGNPPRPLVLALIALVLAPMLSVALLFLAATRPAPPVVGRQSAGEVMLDRRLAPGERATLHVPDTTLEIRTDGRTVGVRAGDGGGAGHLPTAWRGDVERIRVRRVRDAYAVQLRADDGWWSVVVDGAATRTDDTVSHRLASRLPVFAWPAIGLAFLLSATLLARALAPLGEVRRMYGAPATERPPLEQLRAARRDAVRAAWTIVGVLAGPALLAVSAGVVAFTR